MSGAEKADCTPPTWQRQPAGITFEIDGAGKRTYSVRGNAADLVPEEAEEDVASK